MDRIYRGESSEEILESTEESNYGLQETPVEFFSTGSIPFNLAASGKGRNGGWARARVINIVGDRSSGKTLLALEACHWAYRNFPRIKSRFFPEVENVITQFNSVEGVMDFPIPYMYGKDFYDSVDWSRRGTAEEAGRHVVREMDNMKPGTSIIHVIDSWDSLDSEEDKAKFMKSVKDDKPIEGSYHLGKQAFGSKHFFKTVADKLEYNAIDFTLIIISQVRKRIGQTFGSAEYRAGGAALDFYSHQICWLREAGKLQGKEIRGEKVVNGINVEGVFRKNKVAPPFRKGNATIYFNYGVDDISSMINYAFKDTDSYDLPSLEKPYKMRNYFEDKVLASPEVFMPELVQACENKWFEIEEGSKVSRPPKFGPGSIDYLFGEDS